MPDTVNPYIPGQPVDNPDLFFGRRDLVTSLREHLLMGRRVLVVSGAQRMGKSSLLRQLPNHLSDEFLSVRVDLLEEGARSPNWLLWRLADLIWHEVDQRLGLTGQGPALTEFEEGKEVFAERYWPEICSALGERCLVLMLDDLDSLADDGEQDLQGLLVSFLEGLREQDGMLALIMSMSVTQQEVLLRRYGRLLGGAVTNSLGPLNSDEATRLITWPVDGVLAYDYGVARRMIEITSGQPYYLQLLCFEVFNRCAATGWVNQHDVDLVMEDLLGREISDFRQVWHESSPPEQAVLAALVSLRGARGVATVQEVRTILNKAGTAAKREQVAGALDRLVERGILERLGALSYRFRVALLRDWLSERIDLSEVARNTRWQAVRPSDATAGQRVPKLPTRRGRRARMVGKPDWEQDDSTDEQTAASPAWRRWLLIGLAAVSVIVLLVIVVPRLFDTSPGASTPVARRTELPATHPVTATLTRSPTETSPAAAEVSPTIAATLTPEATAKASPTPPLIVARSVPSIVYQSRESGDSRWYVHVMNNDGSDRARLAEGQSGFLSAPSWSPDGSTLAYVSEADGNPDIWVVDLDGSNAINLTQEESKDHSPAWSPDGAWIAFASLRDSRYWELYAMRPDGSDVQRLTWWEDASDLSPSWSPDGTRLAFASKRDGNWEIYTMDREGGNLVRLTNDPADDTNPAWAPDGSRIAFVSTRDGYAEIYVMSITGGPATNISNAPYSSEHGPTWSPDGSRLAFYSDRDGGWNIHVMASDGSDVIRLTGGQSNDQVPAWRP
jgi:Tol biopolymer transport system component